MTKTNTTRPHHIPNISKKKRSLGNNKNININIKKIFFLKDKVKKKKKSTTTKICSITFA